MRGHQQSSQRRLNRHWQSGKKETEKFYFTSTDLEYGTFSSMTYFTEDEQGNKSWYVGGSGPVDNKQYLIGHTQAFKDLWHRIYRMRVGDHMLVHVKLHKPTLSPYPANYPNWVPPLLYLLPEIGSSTAYYQLTQPTRNTYSIPGISGTYFNPVSDQFVLDYTMVRNVITDYTQEYAPLGRFFDFVFGDSSAVPINYVTIAGLSAGQFYEWSYIDGYIEFL